MRLFKITKNDVIRAQRAMFQWDEEEERFWNIDTDNYEDVSEMKYPNAIYKSNDLDNPIEVKEGDLIEITDSDSCSGELFTIIDTSVIDLMELLDVAHKASIGLNEYTTGIDGERFYEPYEVYDLTKNDTDKIPAKKD